MTKPISRAFTVRAGGHRAWPLHHALHVCAFVATVAAPLSAQDVKYVPLVAQLPASIRSVALGGAYLSSRDASSLFANPTAAGVANGIEVDMSRFGAVATGARAATSMSFGSRGLGLGISWLDYGAPDQGLGWQSLGVRGPVDGLSAMAVAAGSLTFKGVRVGGAAKLLQERVANSHDATAGYDVGAAKDFGWLSTSVAVQNIGSSIDVRSQPWKLPMRYTVNAFTQSAPVGPVDIALASTVSVRRDGFVSAGGGLEVVYAPLEGYSVSFRAGARRDEARSVNPAGLGATFSMDRFSIDYSYQDLRAPLRGGVHSMGIRVR